jgi:hypothetical protein
MENQIKRPETLNNHRENSRASQAVEPLAEKSE